METKYPGAASVSIEVVQIIANNDVFHRLSALRVFHWLAKVAWLVSADGAEASGNGWTARVQRDGTVAIEVFGGQAGLANAVGVVARNDHDIPWKAIQSLAKLHPITVSYGKRFSGALVTDVSYKRGSCAGAGRIAFTLSPLWNGCWLWNNVPKSRGWLFPSIGVPPLDGVPSRQQPRVALMEIAAIIEMVERSPELARRGFINLDWDEFGARFGLEKSVIDRVLGMWCEQDRWRRAA